MTEQKVYQCSGNDTAWDIKAFDHLDAAEQFAALCLPSILLWHPEAPDNAVTVEVRDETTLHEYMFFFTLAAPEIKGQHCLMRSEPVEK
jgi:hypothetical protein